VEARMTINRKLGGNREMPKRLEGDFDYFISQSDLSIKTTEYVLQGEPAKP
jgi:hypothetical protein